MGTNGTIKHHPTRPEIAETYANHDKLRCIFNPPPTMSLARGLAEAITYARHHGSVEPTMQVSPEITKNMPVTWKEFVDESNPLRESALTAAGRHAILISGGTNRFIFRESRIGGIDNNTDVFIHLHDSQQATVWYTAAPIDRVPYEVSVQTIHAYFTSLGAGSVHVRIYSTEEISDFAQSMNLVVGQHRLSNYSEYILEHRWRPHSIMFLLRHLAFQAALDFSAFNGFKYKNILYQREDNVYYSEKPMQLPINSLLSNKASCLHWNRTPCIQLSKFCPFKSASDKIYFTNMKGAEIAFSATWDAFVTFLIGWVEMDMINKDPQLQTGEIMGTERFLFKWFRDHNATMESQNFQRTEMRYSNNQLCIVEVYRNCGDDGFASTPWMKETGVVVPCKHSRRRLRLRP